MIGRTDDGRLALRLRQSNIGTFQMCPEKARRDLYDPQPQQWTDLTALGTAVHAGIEFALREQVVGVPADLSHMVEVAASELATIGDWKRTKFDADHVFLVADRLLAAWYDHHYRSYEPLRVEETFSLPLYEDDRMVVTLTGTPDTVDTDGIVHDHKTASRPYSPEAWQRQRWAVQPTAYLWATWVEAHGLDAPMPTLLFQYDVMVHDGTTETVSITRDQSHVDWLRAQARQIGLMVLAEISPWPQIDSGWWCSDKWCQAFAAGECKGAHMRNDSWLRPQTKDAANMMEVVAQ